MWWTRSRKSRYWNSSESIAFLFFWVRMSSVLLVWVVVGWHWHTSHSLPLPSHHSVFFNRIIKDGEIIRSLWLEKQLDACEMQHNDCFPMQMQLCNAAALQVRMTLPWRFFFICTLQATHNNQIKKKSGQPSKWISTSLSMLMLLSSSYCLALAFRVLALESWNKWTTCTRHRHKRQD